MGKVKNFEIILDKTVPVFREGDDICGVLRVVNEEPVKFKSIRIELCGIAVVLWAKNEYDSDNEREVDEKFSGDCKKEQYYNHKIELVKKDPGILEEDLTLEAGEHIYSFESKLPQELPSTFEGAFGQVRYLAKGVIERSWRSNVITKKAFTVVSGLDLNFLPEAASKIELCKYQTFTGCCVDRGTITVDWTVPRSGFVPGESIKVHCAVQNESKYPVHLSGAALYLVVTYKSGKRKKREMKSVASVEKGVTAPGDVMVWEEEIHIPPLPPTGLGRCGLIDVNYELQFTALIEGRKTPIKFVRDIYIGTVPISRREMRSCLAGMYNQPYEGSMEQLEQLQPAKASQLSLTQIVTVASALEAKTDPSAPTLPSTENLSETPECMVTSHISEAQVEERPPPFAPGVDAPDHSSKSSKFAETRSCQDLLKESTTDSNSMKSNRTGGLTESSSIHISNFKALDPACMVANPTSMRNLFAGSGEISQIDVASLSGAHDEQSMSGVHDGRSLSGVHDVSKAAEDSAERSPSSDGLEPSYEASEWGPVSIKDSSDDDGVSIHGELSYQPVYTYYRTVKKKKPEAQNTQAHPSKGQAAEAQASTVQSPEVQLPSTQAAEVHSSEVTFDLPDPPTDTPGQPSVGKVEKEPNCSKPLLAES